MMEDPEKVGDYASSVVMVAFAVVVVALMLAGGAWVFAQVWPW